MTAEKFIANPFVAGDRIYKTGDLARWLPDGNIEYIGRKDNQVKIRGYRIELGEIENALSLVAGISQCCVLAKEDASGNKRLVGYVVSEEKLDKTYLQDQLKSSLPEYMVPMIWVELDQMPLTSNGKLDRKSLPEPESSDLSTKEYVAPRTEREEQLAAIWQNLLGIEKVGIHDNFFELGGHSLMATRLVSMVRKELSVELSIRDVFEYTSIEALSGHVSLQSGGVLLPAVVAEERPVRIPLSFSQERLWFLDQLQGSTEYHIPIVLRLEGALDVSILERTLKTIVSRHEVLRTILLSEEGVGYQQVIGWEDWMLDQKKIKDAALLPSILQDYLQVSFDLSKDYKLRGCLYDLGDQKYVLACVFHHIASDGWSGGILVNEFMELYSAFESGREAVLPELSLQYSDYALWQRRYLEGSVLESQLSYWEEKLQKVATLSLPTDYARPSVQSTSGSSVSALLDKELSESLNGLCHKQGVTLFMLMLSAFKVLLSRYSGQDDICVGTPIANRTQSDLEGMIGFFVNTLALRSDLEGNPSFSELLGRVKQTTLEGYDHQLVPFEKVVEKVVSSRDMSMTPLFQVMFELQNKQISSGNEEKELKGLTISGHEYSSTTAQFDLTLNVSEGNNGIALNMNYCTSLFDKATIERMLLHYQELLESIVFDVAQPVATLSMLTVAEEQQLLNVFNNTSVAYPKDKTIVDLFEEQAGKTPDAVAVVYEGEELSYRQLNERSNQLGHYLREQGVQADTLVGICLERGLDMIVAILGVLKSGGAYVPIDSDYPQDRIDYIIEDSGISFFVTQQSYEFLIEDKTRITGVVIDLCREIIKQQPVTALNIALDSQQTVYCIYTSGSTGRPKGVGISHTSLLNIALNWERSYNLDSTTCLLQMASFSFDVFSGDLCRSLLFGGKMILCPSDLRLDPAQLYKLIWESRVNILEGTPGLLIPLMDYIYDQGLDYDWMNLLILGSDLCSVNDFKRMYIRFGHSMRIINSYGTTETTIDSSYFEVDNVSTLDGLVNVPIGKPLWNNSFYVLNKFNTLLPVGIIGELCIGGAGVAQGYLNREELTQEKFVLNPFVKGERIYKTGDLARWLPDGNLELIGRQDNQVKIRGYRIELGEIENVLSSISGISQCCVLAKEDASGNKRLVGYVVAEDKLDKVNLQAQLKSSLPEYMVPMIWVELEKMPLTSNGKLDRRILPDPESSDLSSKEYVAPRTETERQLTEIWEKLLGVEKVGIHDNFFELGGHSLLATRLVSMIRKEMLLEVYIREIFVYTSIAALAAHVSVQSIGALLPAVVAEIRPQRIPLSFSQERLWFLDQLEGSAAYHMPVVLRLEGTVDKAILEQTLRSIVLRHEVLRTILLSEDGIAYQEVISIEDWKLDIVKVTDESLFENSLQDYLLVPFDLSKDYKLRSCLYDLGNEKYVLACVFHHIASDGWSEGILVNEFMELYSAFQSGRPAVLPELTLQYSDYAIWQRKYLEGIVLESQLRYWEDKLKDVATLILPTDYPRLSVQNTAGSNVSLVLDKELSRSLNTLCQQEGVTLFMVLLSAFKVLLSRYSGQDDICVGTPIANRTQSELEGMIGFFVNTLAIRNDMSGNPSFRELLERVKQTTLDGYDHQLAPFEKVVERVVTTRNMNMSPLFQVMFVLQNTPEGPCDSSLENIMFLGYELNTFNSKFDLTLNISESQNNIVLDMDYCTALFDKSTIERILLHYKELLIGVVNNIGQPIDSLSMLTREEEHQLLTIFNTSELSYPKDKTIVDLFKAQVIKTPEATALVFEDDVMTYKELDERSNQLVHYFESIGMTSGLRIGILFNRGFDMIIGILATLKSGCTYIPLDPALPSQRLSYILEDSSVNFLLYREESLVSDLSFSEFIISLDITKSFNYNSSEILYKAVSDSVAYIMYTSGTTGNPKGVMVTDGNIVSLCTSCDYISLDSDTVWLSTGSISFDATTIEFFGTLLNGGQLVLTDTNKLLNVASLKKLIIKYKVTTMWMTASWFHQVVEDDFSIFGPLNYLIVGGDVVLFNYTNKLRELYPKLKIINGYGPTENTTFSTTYSIDKVTDKNLPIGKPINNRVAYILNASLDLVPIGVVGELCVGGAGVARGYLNREELTAEKFIANPFVAGDRIYKTGDLARWLPDGNIEYIGRKDNQVKIRGYRIELGEIENALSLVAGISQCCVLAKEDASGNKRLVGYVVSEEKLDKTYLQDQLKSSLPEYMVPMIWVELDQMPLTSNGKLDRKSLPEPESSDLSTKEYVAPRTETEEQLAAIWQNLLGIEKVGIHDNFFELGGHSLLATRLVSMVRKELSVELSIRDVFEYTSIEALSGHVSLQSGGVLLPAVGVEEKPDRVPLSFSQERLWFLDQLQGSTEYHIPIVLRLEGALDVSILERTLKTIVSRHEVLRTILLSEEGVGYQQVIGWEDWMLDQKKIKDAALLPSILQDYLQVSFDLSKDYKLRGCLYDLGDQKYVLACVFHHIASDGWSGGILVNEFMELYSAFESGREAVLPELSLQYSDYALWQRRYLEGSVLESQLSYWEEKLQEVATLSLPTDYARPSVQSTSGSSVSAVLDKELSESLNGLCHKQGVTLFMLMLSAFKVLLSRYSGQDDICVGTPIANRTQSDLEGMIGFFVNTLALRSDLEGNPSFSELLGRVKQTTLEGYDHQLVPFEKVVEKVVSSRDMSMTPLFQVMFVLQNTPEGSGGTALDDVEISSYGFETSVSKFDLTFTISEGSNGIALDMVYCTDLFDKSTIDRMLLHYQGLLSDIVRNLHQPIGSLRMLTAEEEHQLLDVFNDTTVGYPKDKTIIELFEEQVMNTPDAVAVVYDGEELSYRELNERSNQLGRYLRDQGVQADTLVGICLERSLEMLVGILGILKSGAAYVPIDPDYPQDRISYMVGDAGMKQVLSSSSSHKVLEQYGDLSVVLLDTDLGRMSNYSTENLSVAVRPSDLAYVIYTSGSTGRPKGVMIEHNTVVNLITSQSHTFNIDSGDVVLQFSNYAFDASVEQIFITLLNGSKLVLIPKEIILDTENLLGFIDSQKITHFHTTPSMLSSLPVRTDLKSLRRVVVGGEICGKDLMKVWNEAYSFYNKYGPTETTVTSTISFYEKGNCGDKEISIGTPIANTQVYILDSEMNLLPVGVVGELCIGGAGVARGYLNREELTAERFIANPFAAGERIYKTGDLARWLPDGNIEYIGRKDNQVKIRGYRIELGEIENALSLVAGISQCCVLAKEDASGNKRLVGYVVSEEKLDRTYLQDQLKSSLPEYMVPMIWVELDQMPLTSNGKLDRKSLPEPESSDLSTKEYVAPRTETEEQLAAIWQNLLGIEKVGIHDNFFELGGHSLLATRLVSMVRKELSVELSIRDVFEYTSIEALSGHVSLQSTGVLLPAVVAEERPVRIPLSFSQERLWFLDQLQGSTEYHIPTVLRLEGALDVSVLEQTLQSIVSRHEVLRTVLLSEDGVGYQEVIGVEDWILDQVTVTDAALFENDLQEYLIMPFDLSKEYKLRSCLYDLGNQQYVLACVLHHIASDGWSGGILVNEFMELYSALQSGRTAVLPELSLQYADYAIWQRKYLEGAVLESQLSYWQEQLQGVTMLSFTNRLHRPSVQSMAGSSIFLVLDKELSESLNALSQREGVTLFMLLLSGFKVLLSRYSGQDDICVGYFYCEPYPIGVGRYDWIFCKCTGTAQ
ncbi:non-ribosomal peptide synthetase [Flavobacterium anhuiense]|uniref:non-ribosomal peptide synthetase n=1 Tax=Flavobacterium anhuiense TaxID=459526 RepID=UPI0021BD0215|nr:non-ribosomal peptide synthetase [Flavobacterium anhuiense]